MWWTEKAALHITILFAQTLAATNDRLWLSFISYHSFYSLQILSACKGSVILNSVHRIGAWHPENIHFWATFCHHWVWRNSVAVVRKYFLNRFLIRNFIMKIFSGVSDLFCGFTRCYRNDRHKTAPSPDPLNSFLPTLVTPIVNSYHFSLMLKVLQVLKILHNKHSPL